MSKKNILISVNKVLCCSVFILIFLKSKGYVFGTPFALYYRTEE